VAKTEMDEILKNTGWKAKKYFDSERTSFIAIIEKEGTLTQENSPRFARRGAALSGFRPHHA